MITRCFVLCFALLFCLFEFSFYFHGKSAIWSKSMEAKWRSREPKSRIFEETRRNDFRFSFCVVVTRTVPFCFLPTFFFTLNFVFIFSFTPSLDRPAVLHTIVVPVSSFVFLPFYSSFLLFVFSVFFCSF